MKLRISIPLTALFLLFAAACGPEPITDEDLAVATPDDGLTEELRLGKSLYVANGCATCHGVSGKGDGPAGLSLQPRPRNFRELGAYRQGSSAEAIAATLYNGLKGSNIMRPYRHIKEDDRKRIAEYVVHLRTTPE